jgi:adenosine deaminase
MPLADVGLAELHTHLGGSVASDIMWSLAHEQGIALPVKDYWEFDKLVTVSDPRGVPNLDALDAIYHWTELIQSSPFAVEQSVHSAIGGAYRSQGITTLEVRFNPMKRNRGGERDLDHIILAASRGLDIARLEYPQVRAGLILMMDRTFDARQNEVIVEKAIRWADRGVVGVDIAGPRPGGTRYHYTQLAPMVETARAAGLGITIHVGEEGATGAEEIGEVVESLRPDRIGHGILAARDPELMRGLRDAGITLEICPTSNLLTRALSTEDEVRETFRRFVEHGVAFTIATDGPEMMRTHLRDELALLLRIGALDEAELAQANERGHAASFVGRREPGSAAAGPGPAGSAGGSSSSSRSASSTTVSVACPAVSTAGSVAGSGADGGASGAASAVSPVVVFTRPRSLSRNPMATTIRLPPASRKRGCARGIESDASVVVPVVASRSPDLTARPRHASRSA